MSTTRHSLLHASSSSASGGGGAASASTAALQARIAHKRAELAQLQRVRQLSARLAEQMGALERRLAGLADGAQAVACVLANWDNVMRAIRLAAGGVAAAAAAAAAAATGGDEADSAAADNRHARGQLPVTLVRIPVGIGGEDGGDQGNASGDDKGE